MLRPNEICVDSFAGGGGASLGIQWALGRSPDIAINHDKEAIALHAANHPDSLHLAEDVWKVDPVEACAGRPVGLMWLSPDCKHFSKAKGGKPVSKRIRGLAWVATRWAAAVKPRVIVLENVEEFRTWGPVLPDGKPCPVRRGQTFKAFVRKLERLGYKVEWRELRACDFGAPTIRKRLFLVARSDGQPIEWPTPTHGKGRSLPWRTAAECIDWSIPCYSIFLTKKEVKKLGLRIKRPLEPATMRRLARGVMKFVINNPRPFIVGVGGRQGQSQERGIDQPFQTVTGKADSALVAPFLVPRYGERSGQAPRSQSVEKPLSTIVPTQNGAQLVAAFLSKAYGGNYKGSGAQLDLPIPTLTTQDHNHLVAVHVKRDFGTSTGAAIDTPLPTITADGGGHATLVASFLLSYFEHQQTGNLFEPVPTILSRDRFALVTVNTIEYVIYDIAMRMFVPRELYRAQGFPDSYVIAVLFNGKILSNKAQVRMVGNSVSPYVAAAVLRSLFKTESQPLKVAA